MKGRIVRWLVASLVIFGIFDMGEGLAWNPPSTPSKGGGAASSEPEFAGLLGIARLRRLESIPPILRKLQQQGLLPGLRIAAIEEGIAWMQGHVASLLGIEWSRGLRVIAALAPKPLTDTSIRAFLPTLSKGRLASRIAKRLSRHKERLLTLEAAWRPQLQRLVLVAEIGVSTSMFFRFALRRVLGMVKVPYTEDSVDGEGTFWLAPAPGFSIALFPQNGRMLLLLLWDEAVVRSPSLRRTVWRQWRDLQNSIASDLQLARQRLAAAIPQDHQWGSYVLPQRIARWLQPLPLPSVGDSLRRQLLARVFSSSEGYGFGFLADLTSLQMQEILWPLSNTGASGSLPSSPPQAGSSERREITDVLPLQTSFASNLPHDPTREQRISLAIEEATHPLALLLRAAMKNALLGKTPSLEADLPSLFVQPFFAGGASREMQVFWAHTKSPGLPPSLQAQSLLLTGRFSQDEERIWRHLFSFLPGMIALSINPLRPSKENSPPAPVSKPPPQASLQGTSKTSKPPEIWVWWPSGKTPWVFGIKGERWFFSSDLRLLSEILASPEGLASSPQLLLSEQPSWSLLRLPVWEGGWSFTQLHPEWLGLCVFPASAPNEIRQSLGWFSRLEMAMQKTPSRRTWRYALPLPSRDSKALSAQEKPTTCPFQNGPWNFVWREIVQPFQQAPLGVLLSSLSLLAHPPRTLPR